MIILRIVDLALDDDVHHIATDWQVSDTLAFTNIIAESLANEANKTSIAFNNILDPNQNYYARGRALLSTGYTVWGNLDIFKPDTTYDLDKVKDIPSRISIPTITTDSDPKAHNATLFTIMVSGFSVVGNATHLATSWSIETLEGEVVWSRYRDELNKESILVNEILLDDNVVYRIRAIFHSTSYDSSQIASYTIHVLGGYEISLATQLINIGYSEDSVLTLLPYNGD